MKHSFEDVITRFIDHINSLESTLPLVMLMIYTTTKKSEKNLNDFVEKNGIIKIEKEPGVSIYRLKFDQIYRFNRLRNRYINSTIANTIVPRNFIVSLVSQFDALLGRIIKTMFFIKPEMLNASEKNLTYSQIIEFASLDDVKDYIIEKEVESVLRKSHTEQFKWLENKLNIPLRNGLDIWPTFIELTERRNLFTHCDGVVSSQYLDICRKHNVELEPNCKAGVTLTVSPEYFQQAYKCLFEIGVKLVHVIWRKLQPEDRKKADLNLNNICYDLIDNEKYDLAITLLEFATSFNKYSSEDVKLMLFMNKAQAYKWSKKNNKCKQILEQFDWSAYSYSFKLAKAVLSNEYEQAADIMKRIGPDGEVKQADYRDWPIFKEFRNTEFFLKTYSEIFGEEFSVVERVEKELEQIKEEDEQNSFIDIANEEVASSKEMVGKALK